MMDSSVSHEVDVIRDLEALALASRLRRLADRLSQNVARLHRARGLDLEPRWLPVLWTLARHGPHTSAELVRALGLSATAVSQILAALERRGHVERRLDPTDDHRRPLALTEAGQAAVHRATALWSGIRTATTELLAESGSDLLGQLSAVEAALDEQPLAARLRRQVRPEPDEIEIVDYRPAYRTHFERLNREWIEALFEMEPEDELMLSDPNRQIIRRGGEILFALVDGEVVGTTALLACSPGHMQLAKMAVASPWRGLGIGRRLAEAALERARRRGADRVTLLTNPHLRRAMVLYLSLGFTTKTDQHSAEHMARPSLVMERRLGPGS